MTLVLELLATLVCTAGGIHFWQSSPQADESVRDDARSRGQWDSDAVPRPVAVRATPPSTTSRSDDAGRSAGTEIGAIRERAEASSSSAAPGTRSRHRAQAPPSAIAPLPTLLAAQATAPRVPESLAREALKFVGKDPAAEEMWAEAINQPELSANARSDLIEDLNDEGFPDPNHYQPTDLPLILERLRIIERHAPHAMDDVNAAAFEEAYKDLVSMFVRLRGAASK